MSTKHLLICGDSRKMSLIKDKSVQLIVTSPPYWQLKDYGNSKQIGFNDSYENYINYLNLVWSECFRVLEDGCRLCINIGDQFARSVYYGRYKVIPIHAEIIRFCETIGFDYMGSIVWQKETSMHTTGGESVMGSYPYPRGGIIKIDFEHILLFKKLGKAVRPTMETIEASKMTNEEWNTYFCSHWIFPGARQNKHIAVFPEELPKRLIRMFSFVGDTVLDPFMGSGTTALAAMHLERNSVGYEVNKEYRQFYEEKVVHDNKDVSTSFEYGTDEWNEDISIAMDALPYRFRDIHKLDKKTDVKANTYGSKFEVDISLLNKTTDSSNEMGIKDMGSHFFNKKEPMVLVNHARTSLRILMIEKGICYLRAGDSKGSVLVEPGFERVQYVLLHTYGRESQLFKLKSPGKFQIWTKETLQENGFNPQNAAYYMVMQFNNKPVPMKSCPNLLDGINTFRVKILSFNDFKIK